MDNSPTTAKVLEEAQKGVDGLTRTVRVLSKVLCDTMQEIHGGDFRVLIDHEAQLVLIRGNGDSPALIEKANLREAV